MKKSFALVMSAVCALMTFTCSEPAPYRFPMQILLPIPIPSTFSPLGGGPAVNTTRVYFGMAPDAGYYLSDGSSFSAFQPFPEIDDGKGNTWIPIEMYVTGTNLQFYMLLQVVDDPSRTQLAATLFQPHNLPITMPKTPPFDLSIVPFNEIPAEEVYSLATEGSMQAHTEQNVNNGAFDF